MAQGTDVELGGAGYMVVPGSYARAGGGAGGTEDGARRVGVAGFAGGQRQALAGREDAGWDATGVGPVYGGQGVEPWPGEAIHADAMPDQPSPAKRAHAEIVGNHCYVGVGRRLYRSVPLTNGTWGNLAILHDFGAGAEISGLVYYQDDLLVLLGSGAEIRRYAPGSGLVSVWKTGERVAVGIGYHGQIVSCPGGVASAERLNLSVTKYNGNVIVRSRWLDAPIVSIGLFAGKVAVATRSSLYLMGGQPQPGEPDDPNTGGDQSVPTEWRGDPEPIFSHGVWTAEGDFVFLLAFRGQLYTWLANRVMEWEPGGEAQGWRATGPEGASCHGGCVAAGFLVVAIVTREGDAETWAFDGAGWWRVQRSPAGEPVRCWPTTVGGAGNRDVLVFRTGQPSYDLYRLVWRAPSLHSYRTGAEWRSSLLDGGRRDAAKAWRGVGAAFAVPEARGNQASTAPVRLSLDYSVDGGATWTTAAAMTASDPTRRAFELVAPLASGAAVARFLQLRVVWSGVADWAPVLTGVRAEGAPLDDGARRRRWTLTVAARDGQVGRDGAVQARSGRQLAADLWQAWEEGTTLGFRDLDHDATLRQHQVRIAAIAEAVSKPADAGRWGESAVALTLVEV